jgi:parallel beta-helix repeat protein
MFIAALSAMALGSAPPAMATHVSCGQVLTQNTTLDSDLANCSGNGVVLKDGITLNLAGHTIDGQGNGYGVSVAPPASGPGTGVRVLDGTVRGFADGLRIESASGTFERLVVEDNEDAGARCAQGGQSLVELTVQENETGITSECSTALVRSIVQRNGSHGLNIGFATFTVIESGLWGNGGFGAVLGAVNGTFANSSVYGNGSGGVSIFFAGVTVRGSTFGGNAGTGLEIGFGSSATVQDNVASSNTADGINVGPNAGFDLTGNQADRNGDDGIDVDSASGTLTGNIANRNTDLGIEAAAGVTDGGGNRAKQNGNRLECLNVTCRR